MATPKDIADSLGSIVATTASRVDAIRSGLIQGVVPPEYGQYVLDTLTAMTDTMFNPVPVWNAPFRGPGSKL